MKRNNEGTIGIHERLVTLAVEKISNDTNLKTHCRLAEVDKDDAPAAIAQYLAKLIFDSIQGIRGANSHIARADFANDIIEAISRTCDVDLKHENIAPPLRQLLSVNLSECNREIRPDTPLGFSALITGAPNDPSLGSQLRKEASSCDRIDILCSFIRWSGLRLIMEELKKLGESQTKDSKIRVITTSYMGATDPRAIEALLTIPNLDLKVSYDTKRTRLHAKAYLFHRRTGFGSAYVGSANLSNAALSDGLEWTTKISQYELPHLWSQVNATFDAYWNDSEFKSIRPNDVDEFRAAIQHERDSSRSISNKVNFDLRPYLYQQEILDTLQAEREIQGKHTHLVVAATGTGKTMVAAFDYKNFSASHIKRPKLLFIAHRQEILEQAIQTFRAVLRDHNFGELSVGNYEPKHLDYLFCSIQSFGSRKLDSLGSERWDYIIVDEFHHASAKTYDNFLNHVRPKILLGLTATPERADGQDVLKWFGGSSSTQIRLPDAINRRLLSPFQYFGISDTDNASLEHLEWQRGGYKITDLERIYNGNDIRAQLVVDKIHEYLLSPDSVRALVFCVSVAHAKFMEEFMNSRGLKVISVSGDTKVDERRQIKQKLINREVNFVCVVDLYNEGVDIPEIDTVLFLRPTESLTVFLQQLGRGLRLFEGKDCLTVLDFIGSHRKEFRFASRFRALVAKPTNSVDEEVEKGFPNVPSGCFIKLEKVAKERVLQNVKQSIRMFRPRFLAELKLLSNHISRTPKLADAVAYFCDMDLDEILKKGIWSELLRDAGITQSFIGPNGKELQKGLRRLNLVDDFKLLHKWTTYLNTAPSKLTPCREVEMLHLVLWGQASKDWSLDQCHAKLLSNSSIIDDIVQLLEIKTSTPKILPGKWREHIPLNVHGEYGKSEILVALGHWTIENRPRFTEGVLHLKKEKADVFFVDLKKSTKQFSPTTMYNDYIISDSLFHWQSQSTTSDTSPTGKRYIKHQTHGYTPLLFVRYERKLKSGLTSPFNFFGPCEYQSHYGSNPISFEWKLRYPIPARLSRLKTQSVI